ncbi:putative oxidoreductase C1F5.03c [Cucumis sativus]|uniref:FAD dependent oxidoreductase domain-containing protein n=1 Tax=Cucumis sativus TaxID=3659 RepID=A0A0A0KLE7_CUCSA|nr:putative oxidoreductase C1F5.03c [Cucumis sativus]KGN48556.1 hypothetical protein Csa_004148 [Cucumis sativus]
MAGTLPVSSFSPILRYIPNSRASTLTLIRSSSSPVTSPVSMDTPQETRKVVVCGGGVIGVCTAYFLAKNGAAVTLVEKSAIACAASGKAGGFLAYDWCDGGPISALARASFNLHRSLSQELDGPKSYGYRALDTLSLTISESQKPPTPSTSSKSTGDSVVPSWVDGPVQNTRTIGNTETTAQVHPQHFTRTLLSNAMEKYGVEVVIGKLEKLTLEGGRFQSAMLEDGQVISADAVVLALGPWSGKFEALSSLFRVYGLKAHSIVLEPKEPEAITPHALFLGYYPAQGGRPIDPEMYPRPTGEVYLCGMSAVEEVPEDPEEITPNPESISVLKRVAKTVSSRLGEGEAELKAEQACFLPCTDDDLPVIGKLPGVSECYVATGHSCWGILNGPATGAAMAELILDGESAIVDLNRFSPARFVGRGRNR